MFESQFGLLRSLKPPQDVSLCLSLFVVPAGFILIWWT